MSTSIPQEIKNKLIQMGKDYVIVDNELFNSLSKEATPQNLKIWSEDDFSNGAFEGYKLSQKEILELKKEIDGLKTQVRAYKTLQETGDKIRAHQSKLISESQTVDSEREANEMLTNENELLKKEIERLQGLIKGTGRDYNI